MPRPQGPQPPAFADRVQAGRALAAELQGLRGQEPLVLGIPRGGVPVAAEVAALLGGDLDVVLARKLGHPQHPEYGVGAIAEGVLVADEAASGVGEAALARVQAEETRELQRRTAVFRRGRPPPKVTGRTVVVVDDGVAAGVTARAALRSLRRLGPRRLVFATPVGAPQALRQLRDEADDVVAAVAPASLRAVGHWYGDFPQLGDDEVLAVLGAARPGRAASGIGAATAS